MIAIIFEVQPACGHYEDYLSIAEKLRPELEKIDGFISVERFQSLSNSNNILSLSFFRDEEAVKQWRTLSAHRSAQQAGRAGIFSHYRLRVATVIRDYGLNERGDAPTDSKEALVD